MDKKKDSASQLRQLDLVKQYYEVNEEKKTVQLVLTYKKASMLLVQDVSKLKRPLLSQKIILRLKEIIETFPDGYSAELKLVIDDYEGYDPKALLEAFNDKLEFNSYSAQTDYKKGWFQALLLTVAGLVLMVFNLHAKKYGWYGSGTENDAFQMVFDSFATLLIWEAGTVIFLSPSNYKAITRMFLNRISTVSLLNGKTNEVLVSEKGEDITQNWKQGKLVNNIGRTLLIFCTFLFAVEALSTLSTAIQLLMDTAFPWETRTSLTFFSYLMGFVWDCLAIVAGFEYYVEKGKLRKALPFFAVFSFVVSFVLLIVSSIQMQQNSTFSIILIVRYFLNLFASLGYGIGYFLVAVANKKMKKEMQSK